MVLICADFRLPDSGDVCAFCADSSVVFFYDDPFEEDLFLLSDVNDGRDTAGDGTTADSNETSDNSSDSDNTDDSGNSEDSGKNDNSGDNTHNPTDGNSGDNTDKETDDRSDRDENAEDNASDSDTDDNTENGDSENAEGGDNPEDAEDTDDRPEFDIPVSDDYFSITQYSYYNIGKYMRYIGDKFTEYASTPEIDLDIPGGWKAYSEGKHRKDPVIIAVIDTGIDYRHPDLADNIWINENEIPDNGIDDDGNGYVDDIYGWDFYNNDNTICHYKYNEAAGSELADPDDCDDHGTRVAGLIGAVKDNQIGIAGIASVGNIRIMSLKIHGGSNRKGKTQDAIKAIKYAEQMGASICNISWGTYTYSSALASAVKNSNMLFVCAAGNDGTDNDERPIYPASFGFDNVISVGFVNADGTLSFNSNYGKNSVDIVVPSTDIMSTIVGSYSSISGSSMAAPQISAIAALLYTYGDHTWAGAVRDIIVGSVKKIDDLEKIIKYPGIPSLYASIQNAGMMPYDPNAPEYTVNVNYDANGIRIGIVPLTEDVSGIGKISYMPGIRKLEDFKNGTEGLIAEENIFYLAKPGVYTFYVSDRAGNATVKTIPVLDDIVLPSISDAVLNVDNELAELIVSAHVTDKHSGIKTVKYMRGKHDIADFKRSGAGTVLTPDDEGNISFSVAEQGAYTIYASDNRGNSAVMTVMAYLRPSLAIELKAVKHSMNIGNRWSIGAKLIPAGSTDSISYISSDENIATISDSGRITALAAGICTVTARTTSGKEAECMITVE